MFDVSGLIEEKMLKRDYHKWNGSYYLDANGACIARTCSVCKEPVHVDDMGKCKKSKYGLSSTCLPCKRDINKSRKNLKSPDGVGNYGAYYQRQLTARRRKRTEEELDSDKHKYNPLGLKDCNYCGVSTPLTSFFTNASNRDGLTAGCKPCEYSRARERRIKPMISYWNNKGIPLVCYVCGGPWEDSDHVVPIKLGGVDDMHNRLPMCKVCNTSKWKHPLRDWLIRKYPEKYDDVINRVTILYGMDC